MPPLPTDAATLTAERARLARLCRRLTGDLDAAEDLAQETLHEALRNAHKLRDGSGYAQWLSAIARNVCLRWNSARGRDARRLAAPAQDWDVLDEGYDLDAELSRHELADLLDRALALLPPQSREVLVERYVHESSHAETAARLGLTEAAVAKRLERGRLRLKRLLSTDLLKEAVAHGLVGGAPEGWDETSLWCPCCGERRLLGRFTPRRELWLYCMPCGDFPANEVARAGSAALFRGVKGYRAAALRLMEADADLAARGARGEVRRCPRCGGTVPLVMGVAPILGGHHYARADCARCGLCLAHFTSFWVAQTTPEGRAFWRAHPRHVFLPEREIEWQGTPAIVTGARSLTGSARIEVVLARDTLRGLDLHVTAGA
jgi:RNA polymerase sigma-70 factor (ECF subfamily)